MKESTLLEMQNKIAALTRVVQQMVNELEYLRTVSMGTLETIKHMPDYDDALGKVKEKINKEKDGVKQQDTK
jgi:hypothetical protein